MTDDDVPSALLHIPHNNIIPLCYSQPLKNIIVYTTMKDRKWWLVSFFEVFEVGLFIWRVGFGLGTTPTTASCAVSSRKLFSTMEDNVEIICFLCALESDMMYSSSSDKSSNIYSLNWMTGLHLIAAACPKLEWAQLLEVWTYQGKQRWNWYLCGIWSELEMRRLAGRWGWEIEKPSTSQLICSRNSSNNNNNNH